MLPGESHVLLIKLGRYVIAGVFAVKAPSHWLVHGHMTSNNETVSRQKMSGQHCKNYDVKRETVHVHCYVTHEMLTSAARDLRRPDVAAGTSARFSKFAFVLFCYITNHSFYFPKE